MCECKWPPDKDLPLTAAVPCLASDRPSFNSYLCFQSKICPPRGHPNRYGGIPQCPIHMARMSAKLVPTHRSDIGDTDPHVPWCRYQYNHGHIGETMAGGPPQSWVRGAATPTPAWGWMRDGGTPDIKCTASSFPSPRRAGGKAVYCRRKQRHGGTQEPLQLPKDSSSLCLLPQGPSVRVNGQVGTKEGDISHSSLLRIMHQTPASLF